jgi:hypothetical protein
MLTFQALAISRFFRHDCGVNSCRPHVLQDDLFLKIYSSIWLSQNFLGYNSIVQAMTRMKYCNTVNLSVTNVIQVPNADVEENSTQETTEVSESQVVPEENNKNEQANEDRTVPGTVNSAFNLYILIDP